LSFFADKRSPGIPARPPVANTNEATTTTHTHGSARAAPSPKTKHHRRQIVTSQIIPA
jgi:hypothetical protein